MEGPGARDRRQACRILIGIAVRALLLVSIELVDCRYLCTSVLGSRPLGVWRCLRDT